MAEQLKQPDRFPDHAIGNMQFWFDEMVARIEYEYGSAGMLYLGICPVSGLIMVRRNHMGWNIYPEGSNVDVAWKNHVIERELLGGQ